MNDTTIDLGPAAQRIITLLDGVEDLDHPTPSDIPIGALLDHIDALSVAFTGAAAKDRDVGSQAPPQADGSNLGDDWQARISRRVEAMAVAWRDPRAWTGTTMAGGLELPGEVAGVVALDELVLHGWDLARATDQPYAVGDDEVAACHEFVGQFSQPGQEEMRAGLFGPVVPVPDGASSFDRLLGLAGRDPTWQPSA